jgi:hypothetical protein
MRLRRPVRLVLAFVVVRLVLPWLGRALGLARRRPAMLLVN